MSVSICLCLKSCRWYTGIIQRSTFKMILPFIFTCCGLVGELCFVFFVWPSEVQLCWSIIIPKDIFHLKLKCLNVWVFCLSFLCIPLQDNSNCSIETKLPLGLGSGNGLNAQFVFFSYVFLLLFMLYIVKAEKTSRLAMVCAYLCGFVS